MSTTTAARRIALLSSSSLGLAAVVSAASLGAVMTPTAAFAANECGNPAANGATADTFTCPVGVYATGIQHVSSGDLSVSVAAAQLAPASPTISNFGTGGIVSTAGAAGDNLTLRLTGATSSSSLSFNTAFPALLNAESQAGDVTVEVEVDRVGANLSSAPTIAANNAATTHAIRAVSTGGGDVTVRNLSEVPEPLGSGELLRKGIIQSTGNANAVAIEARSVGGGDVTVDLGYGSAEGRLYGILAQVDGSGAVNIQGVGRANTSVAGSAGVRVVAGTGPVVVESGVYVNNQFSSPAFAGRTGVHVNAGGDITFTGVAQGTEYGVDIANVAAGTTTTINLAGRLNATFNLDQTTGGLAAVRAQGAGTLLVNFTGAQRDLNFDFSGMAAPVQIAVKEGGAWAPTPNAATTVNGNGYDSITIESGGALIAGITASGFNTLEPATVLTFTDPNFVLDNRGTIFVGPDGNSNGDQAQAQEAELRLVGLNEFRHSGAIMLGTISGNRSLTPERLQNVDTDETDNWYDDLMVFQNGTWIGEGGKVIFDADLNETQTNCTRQAVTNDFQAADCLRFVDAVVEGQTYVSISPVLEGDRGRLTQQIMDEGLLLIEGLGATTLAADNFALDPAMKGYNVNEGTLDKGLYQYALLFDEDANQFKLFGTLTGAAYQLPIAATAAHNLWRVSTGSWLERQADLRGAIEPGIGGGVWLRAQGERTDRDIVDTAVLGGLQFSTDSTYTGDTYALTGGIDLISAAEGDTAYVFGLTAGYGHTDVAYAASPNTQAMDAWSGGLYASLVSGPLFVDAVANVNNVIIDTDAPGFGFLPEGTILSSRMISVGGQVETGYRFDLGRGLFAEPLASVSYVRSKMEELDINPDDLSRPGLEVSFEDPSSFRAGVGGRFGLDGEVGPIRTQISVLGRVWNDLEGQNTASIHNLAFPDDPDIRVVDDFSGMFSEFAVGTGLHSLNGRVSGFLNFGGKFGDDYQAVTGSAGVRVNW